MKKINCLIVPIPNDGLPSEHLQITFPEVEKSIAELADIREIEIATKIGTNMDLVRHTDENLNMFKITEEYSVKSFETALDHYHLIAHR